VAVVFQISFPSDSGIGSSHHVRACYHYSLLHIFSNYYRTSPLMQPVFIHNIGHLHKYLDSKHCNKEERMLSDRYIPPNPRYREACFLDTFII
jgi:hypothetical protein